VWGENYEAGGAMASAVFRGDERRGLNDFAGPWKHVAVESTAECKPLSERSPALAGHLSRVRSALARTALLTGICMAVPILLGWLAITMPLDWMVELPWAARAALLVAGSGAAAFVAWRHGIREFFHRPNDEAVALRIERALPEFRSRFIASVQLSQTQNTTLVSALLDQTAEIAGRASLKDVPKRATLLRWLKISLTLLLVAGVACGLARGVALPLFQRAILMDVKVPRKTQIVNGTGNLTIALGDDLRIEATASGIIPTAGKLRITTASGKKQDFVLDRTATNPKAFLRVLQSVQETFQYTIELGDNRTQASRIKVRPRPTIAKIDATQIWPAYTQLPPKQRPMGDLKILAGSKLGIRLKASSNLRSATMRFLAADRKTIVRDTSLKPVLLPPEPGKLSAMTDWEVTADVSSQSATGIAFHLVDEEGVESKATTIYRLDVTPDEVPALRILWPQRREELVTRAATLLVSFEAKDDYGIGKIRLHFAVNWSEGKPYKTIELNLDGETPKELTRRFDWRLANLGVNEGDVIDYWLEAEDINTVTGPGRTMLAEHYQARVVSDADKRADLATRLDDTLRGLNDIKEGQEELSKRLGEMIQIAPK
jgi:hypothetical protein